MKSRNPRLLFASTLSASLLVVFGAIAELTVPGTDLTLPIGNLDAFPPKVQSGVHPTLTWNIIHPQDIDDIVTIEPPGIITPQEDLNMEIRVLGASYQRGWYHNQPVWGTVQALVRVGTGSSWTTFMQDTQDNINPTELQHSETVNALEQIDFAARAHNGSGWLNWRATIWGNTPNVVALVNGDSPPSSVPAFQQGNIESFLQPYLNDSGKISIGPLDVIYLIELGQTNTSASGFDLQDLVILVTFQRM